MNRSQRGSTQHRDRGGNSACGLEADLGHRLKQIYWHGGGTRRAVLARSAHNAEAWLQCAGGVVDLNAFDNTRTGRSLDDHPQVRALRLQCHASRRAGIDMLQIAHRVTPPRAPGPRTGPPRLSRLGVHHEWELSRSFQQCFYLHGTSLIEFPRADDGNEAAYFYHRMDPQQCDGWVLRTWHKHVLFYDPAHNVAVGLVVPKTVTPLRLQIGFASGSKRPPFLLTMFTQTRPRDRDALVHRVHWIAYRPKAPRFWWAQGLVAALKLSGRTAAPRHLAPLLALDELSVARGRPAKLFVLPAGKRTRSQSVSVERAWGDRAVLVDRNVPLREPVTEVTLPSRGLCSGVYRVRVGKRSTSLIVRPSRPGARVLHVLPTSQWRAYSANGNYYGARKWPYTDSFGATVLQSPAPGHKRAFAGRPIPRPDYMPPWWGLSELGLLIAMQALADHHDEAADYCSQEDIHFRRVRLRDYQAVVYGSHCEYATGAERDMVAQYVEDGGGLLMTGGDNFGRRVSFLPDRPDFRFQRVHLDDGWYAGGFRESVKFRTHFGLPFSVSPPYRAPGRLRIVDNEHPITAGFKNGQSLGPGYWEGALTTEHWRTLICLDHACRDYDRRPAAVAVHRQYRMAIMGPMSWTDTVASRGFDHQALLDVFCRTVVHLLERVETKRS